MIKSLAHFCAVSVVAFSAAACAPASKREIFAEYQDRQIARGLLRTDRTPADVTFSNDDLAEHFRRIAFFDYPSDREYVPKRLTRWEGPLKWSLFGTPQGNNSVSRLMDHLARLTNLPIRKVPRSEANFLIMILGEEEQRIARRSMSDRGMQSYFNEFLEAVFDCGAITQWSDSDPVIRSALVYLHGDLDGLYRELCFHEEIAQSLGLFSDDPTVRPSIFNDDEEFALLTTHDELLLRILYDPRLRSGMTAREAMPVVRRIIQEVRPGS